MNSRKLGHSLYFIRTRSNVSKTTDVSTYGISARIASSAVRTLAIILMLVVGGRAYNLFLKEAEALYVSGWSGKCRASDLKIFNVNKYQLRLTVIYAIHLNCTLPTVN